MFFLYLIYFCFFSHLLFTPATNQTQTLYPHIMDGQGDPSGGSGLGVGFGSGQDVTALSAMAQLTQVINSLIEKVDKREAPEPEHYVPGVGRTIEQFFDAFEEYATHKYGESEVAWLPRLGKYLGEPIRGLYIVMRSAGSDYQRIKRILQETYGGQVGGKTKTDYLREFQQTEFNHEEGIPGLVCRLQTLAAGAYRGLEEDALVELVKQQCWQTLPHYIGKPLHFQAMANPGMTLTELIRLGITIQKAEATAASVYSVERDRDRTALPPSLTENSLVPYSGAGHSNFTTPPAKSSVPRLAPPQPKSPSKFGAASGQPKVCTYCDRPGHVKDECYQFNATCYGCGERGHFKNRCPNPQRKGPLSSRTQRGSQPTTARHAPASGVSEARCQFCGEIGHYMATCPGFGIYLDKALDKKLNSRRLPDRDIS